MLTYGVDLTYFIDCVFLEFQDKISASSCFLS